MPAQDHMFLFYLTTKRLTNFPHLAITPHCPPPRTSCPRTSRMGGSAPGSADFDYLHDARNMFAPP